MSACFECGKKADFDHHVVPKSLGGTKTIPLCKRCHGIVHDIRFLSVSKLTSAALQAKRARGERVGHVPFGQRLSDDGVHLEDCADEQAILAQLQALRGEGLSYRKIAAELNRRGAFNRGGRAWNHSSIQAMILRDINEKS